MGKKQSSGRRRGRIWRHGNQLMIRVSAGIDDDTNKRLYLTKSVPLPPNATPQQLKEAHEDAEAIRSHLVYQVDQRRAARTAQTLGDCFDSWLKTHKPNISENTYRNYVQLGRDFLKPALGHIRMTKVDQELPQAAEEFFAALAVCRRNCQGSITTDHHAHGQGNSRFLRDDELEGHQCGKRCQAHQCKPMSGTNRRQIHTLIKGTLDATERWGKILVNPINRIPRPKRDRRRPKAPQPEEAAALINAAFAEDFEWGVNIWLLFMTSSRRSEHCATQLKHINSQRGQICVDPLKTDANSWMSLDPATLDLLAQLRDRIAKKKAGAGLTITGDEFIYSYSPDHSQPGSLSYFTHRFSKMAERLGFHATPHNARHYTASELMASGVDPVAIAHRLNHASPKTTIDYYAAWRPRSDEHAVAVIADQMPDIPAVHRDRAKRDRSAEQSRRTSPELEKRICDLRRRTGWGPKRIQEHLAAEEISIAESTIWKVLKRNNID